MAVTGCSVRIGAAGSSSAWAEQADTTLGTAVSSLGTTELVLENQRDSNLTQNFVVVAVRDSITTLDKETASFLTTQPPGGTEEANRRVVAALLRSLEVLNTASNAATAGDAAGRRRALAAVKLQYRSVTALQADLPGMIP
ncbi:hypothetical protein [Marmoricola sp. RAF53]|uniref:hypothetical protein n=1 Tax=Marmoricola sp. RAF53 TaxID=3233059 RepID=UPI003F962CE9